MQKKTRTSWTAVLIMHGILAGGATAEDLPGGYARYYNILSDFSPAWSPDDTRLLYMTATTGPKGSVYVIAASGGKPVRVVQDDGWSGGRPTWSPDGRRIAFASNRSGVAQIWTSDVSGSDLRQITKAGSGTPGHLSWSPDGKQIAYVSFPDERILIIPALGGEPKPFADGLSPAWAPDGHRIAYTSPGGLIGAQSICVNEVEGGVPKCLGSTRSTVQSDFPLVANWSPDGKRLVSGRIINGRQQMVIVDVAADKVESTIQTDGAAVAPAWSHDGKLIAYTLMDTGNPGEIHTITPDGKHDTRITRQRRYTTARLIHYRSSDGLEIPAWIYEPRRRPAERRAIIWMHGSYTGAIVDWFDRGIQYFVDQGFVVIAPNHRGSAGFGEKLEATRPGTGGGDIDDAAGAVHYLQSQAGVNPARIAAVGFSAGAKLALRTACRKPEMFSGVVDFYGVTDDAAFYREHPETQPLYRQVLGGTPDEKPEAYRAFSAIGCADRIEAPILILHGDVDDVCPITQSLRLADVLKAANKPYELHTFPGASHGFEGQDSVRAFDTALRFLDKRLPVNKPRK